jgi:hypothetical protein
MAPETAAPDSSVSLPEMDALTCALEGMVPIPKASTHSTRLRNPLLERLRKQSS